MKYFVISILLFSFQTAICQSDIEIFLFDLEVKDSQILVTNGKNISNNKGYDNQPSFLNDNTILYASTRNEQTDIAQYKVNYDTRIWLNFTEGGEYSPLKIPNQKAISAVRLDKDGKQRLYSYGMRNGESTELINNLVVAYYTWYNDHTIVSAAIENDSLNLYVSNLKDASNNRFQKNVGRSFHKMPNTNLVSYISKDTTDWEIKSVNPITGATKTITKTLPQVEDMCWMIDGTILMAKNDIIYKMKPRSDKSWKEVISLKNLGIKSISRLSTNAISNKLVIAAEIVETNQSETSNTTNTTNNIATNTMESGSIVQKHIAPFNQRDLDGFVSAFSENVVVSNFPSDTMYVGRSKMKQNYKRFYDSNKAKVNINNRIVYTNMVIDEEIVTLNNRTVRQATIYTTGNDEIQSMTFIANRKVSESPEIIVNKQLEAYNNRNIDAFMATYTTDVKLFTFPNNKTSEGQTAMKKSYDGFFKQTPDLKASIKKRIIIGNKVIDEEEVTINGKVYNAIAIYEVENGLISKVTFIQ